VGDPIVVLGGIVIIILLAAVIILLLRRDRDSNAASNDGRSPKPKEPLSQPGLRGYILHGFDEKGKKVRFEFQFEELRGEGVLIGRGRDSRASLSDEHVGRAHARLRCVGDRLEITDLQTVNKTFVNRNDIGRGQTQPVAIGDEIGFGPVVKLRLAGLGQ
jgi:hypothetical protein